MPLEAELVEFGEDEAKRSALIDRATVQLEAATDPAVKRAWQAVLDELTVNLPPPAA